METDEQLDYVDDQEMSNDRSGSSVDVNSSSTCEPSGAILNSKSESLEHNEESHGTGYKKCKICGLAFKRISMHMKSHFNEKSFPCEYCNRKFLHCQSMVRHLSVHTGIKPFQCVACKEEFLKLTDLRTHQCPPPISGNKPTLP